MPGIRAPLLNFRPHPQRRRRVGFTHLAYWSLGEVQARYKAAEARVAVLHGRRFIRGMAASDVEQLRAVPANQRPRALKLAQQEMNVLREELRRRM
jgi:hypothetical protein